MVLMAQVVLGLLGEHVRQFVRLQPGPPRLRQCVAPALPAWQVAPRRWNYQRAEQATGSTTFDAARLRDVHCQLEEVERRPDSASLLI
jgi:hypothetical protein